MWAEEGFAPIELDGATELDPLPQGQPFSFDAQRPAIAARGLSEAENELNGLLQQGLDIVVAFAHRGEALRQQALLRRSTAHMLEPGEAPKGLAFAVSPARRGFVWRDLGVALLPDTQVFRKRPPRATAAPGRALAELLRPAHGRLRRARGPRRRAAERLRDEGGRGRHPRLPAARLPRRRPRLRPARADRQGLPLHRLRLEGARALEARRQGLGQPQDARARAPARDGGRAAAAVRGAADAAGRRLRRRARVGRAARVGVPVPRDRGPADGDRGGQGGSRVRAPDGPARLRRRRLRQDRGRAARRVRGRRQRQAGADARADDGARPAALEHLPRPLPRLPGAGRDGVALPQAGRREEGARRVQRGQGRGPDRHAPRPLARRDPEGARARGRRRGAALRRRAEGAAAPAAARGRRARAERDADPAHAPHVARGPARHLGDRDAARGPPPDPHVRRRVRRGADQAGARARARAQRPGVLSAQPGRDDRGGGREAPDRSARTCASSSRTARCRSASSRTRC